MPGAEASVERWRKGIAPLLADPASSAVMSDLDGTLAPIVARPELVEVPDRAREALGRIGERFALCAVVTGRRPEAARGIVGLPKIAYAGNHGFELLDPGTQRSMPNPALEGVEGVVVAFMEEMATNEDLEAAGLRVEDKGPIIALHWRGAADEPAAEREAARLASAARARGLHAHAGRKVLELRPAVAIDKGVAIESLLAGSGARRAMYAGDDRTDLDGFRKLGELRDTGALDAILRIGVLSPEGPAELVEAADVTVDGTEELIDLLEAVAAGGAPV